MQIIKCHKAFLTTSIEIINLKISGLQSKMLVLSSEGFIRSQCSWNWLVLLFIKSCHKGTRTFSDGVFDLYSSRLSSVVRSSCALLERAVEDPVHPNPLDSSPAEDSERKVVFFLFVYPKSSLSLQSPHWTEKSHWSG